MTVRRLTCLNYPNDPTTADPDHDVGRPLTDSAMRAVREAVRRVLEWSLPVTPILVLWGVLQWKGSGRLGLSVLQKCGVDTDAMEQETHDAIARGFGQRKDATIDFAAICSVVDLAEIEAELQGVDYIGTEHLVLACFKLQDDTVRKRMQRPGLSYERYKAKLSELLGSCQ